MAPRLQTILWPFFREAKAALTELEELKNRHHELEITEKRLEKTLLAEKRLWMTTSG